MNIKVSDSDDRHETRPQSEFGNYDLRIQGPEPDPMTMGRAWRAAATRLKLARKYLWQRLRYRANQPKTPVFILGCQRSGTTMLGEILDQSPEIWVYPEGTNAALKYGLLRDADTIKGLIAHSHAPTIAFKPIMNSQAADRILELDSRAVAIWIFRHYGDVANSAVRYWGEHQKDVLRWIRDGAWPKLGWRAERLTPALIARVSELYADDMPAEDAAAVFWYLRNQFYFAQALDSNPRVLLVKYEDLVAQPETSFARIFEAIGCKLSPRFLSSIFATSVRKSPFAARDPRIQQMCDELFERLDQTYRDMIATE